METTEIVINEHGDETHESWLLVRANKISGGTRLFDSEINHQHWIRVTICRCSRKRDLKRDWLHAHEVLMEFDMSEAQWGAFVSSFGDGSGVPATLTWTNGKIPSAPVESRLNESHKEVKRAGQEALEEIQQAFDDLESAFEEGAGKRVLREKIHDLHWRLKNAPANMEFAAKSLTEHVENVVTKARADIEAMVLSAEHSKALEAAGPIALLSEPGRPGNDEPDERHDYEA